MPKAVLLSHALVTEEGLKIRDVYKSEEVVGGYRTCPELHKDNKIPSRLHCMYHNGSNSHLPMQGNLHRRYRFVISSPDYRE